jgi:hypothetical protein
VKRFPTALLLILAPLPALAQAPGQLTDAAADSIMAFYNHPTTLRVSGESRVPQGTLVDGNLAALGGTLTLGGTVRGDVVVINGDLRLLSGARIEGAVTVVGGRFEGPTSAATGGVVLYHETLRFRREGDRMVPPAGDVGLWPAAGRTTRFGRADLQLGIRGSYNRVEGLPVQLGPRLELGHSNPTVLDGRLVYRTRSGLRIHPSDLGYDVSVSQYLGGRRAALLGLGVHDLNDPIEDAGISNTENSLSTFVLHQDHRDHFGRAGWRAYLRFIGPTRPYDVKVEYRDERHVSMDPATPWSLLRNDSPWRAQPRVAEGILRSITGSFLWDSRNHPTDPAAGWLVAVSVEQGLGGTLTHRESDTGLDPPLAPRQADSEFTSVAVDARRYLRLGPRSRVALRAHAAGAPDSGPLPAQRQLALGGEGTLPGFGRFAFDCGARSGGIDFEGYYPYYGCDRRLLLQAEYRFALLAGQGISRRLGLDFDLFATPELVLFADAGRAWIEARGLDGRADPGPRSLHADVGAGVRLGPLGLYIATPVSGAGGATNFFVRLGPRL